MTAEPSLVEEMEIDEKEAMNDRSFERWLAGPHLPTDLANAMMHQAHGMKRKMGLRKARL